MSVYEEIINGTYKKKKESVYESIVNGTYETQTQIAERKKQEQQQKLNKVSSYQNTKKTAMKQIGTQIKQQSEARKQQEEIINNEIKKQVNNINSNFNKENSQNMQLPTVKNTSSNKINNNSASNYRNTVLQETSKKILPTNVRLSTAEEKNNFNEFKNGDMYKLSNGAIDDRSNIKKVKDATINNIVAPIGNAGVGIVQSIGNLANYEDQAFKFGSRMLGRAITRNEQAGDALGNLLYEKKGRELITGVDSDTYNRDMQALKTWSNETIQRNIENTDNPLSKKIAELAPSVGQNIVPMAVTAVNPFAGTTLFMTSAAGGYYDDAIDRGMNKNQAFGYATIMGIAEGGSEALISGGMVSKVKTALTGSGLSEAFLNSLGTEIIENFAQEAIMEPLSEGTATLIGGKETANWDNILQRSINAGIDGILSAILLKGVSLGIGSANNIIEKVNNNQQVTEQDIKNMINDLKKNDKTGYEQTIQGTVDAIIEQIQNSPINLQQGQANNLANLQTQQTIQQENKTAQNELSGQINNNLANNQETLYNNNESESDINERYKRNINEGRNGLYKEQENQSNREYNWKEYNEWEQSIKPITKNNLTNSEKELIRKAKVEHNKDVLLYNENENNNKYSGGASQNTKDKITISKQKAEVFGLDNMIEHETVESDILHNDEARDILSPIIDLIQEDNKFNLQKDNFWKGQEGNIPSDSLIAKDIICDRFAEIRNGKKIDYDNVLSVSTNSSIDMALTNYYKQVYGKELEIPSSFNSSMQNNIQNGETNLEKYTKYKKNIIDRREEQANSLISYKNATIRNIDKKIAEKQNLLNSKKNKDTKVANTIKIQIENLKTQKEKVFNLYNEKIDKVNEKTNKEKINFETRNLLKKQARENLRAEISPLTADLTKYKDKKAGILYNRETAQRNIDDIVSDRELAKAIKETIFDPVQVHQAQKVREINQLFDKINSLNLDKDKKYDYTVADNTISGKVTETKKYIKIDEATLAQLLIEKKITDIDLKNTYNMGNKQIKKIHKVAYTFTEILDYLYNRMNEEQIKYGYSPIGKLNNYFPHFFENKPDTMLGKIASYFGIDLTNKELPTEIAGKTDTFKPGKTWNSNTLQRKTNKTDYDALKAMEKYIQGASDIIYTTEDIQKIREFERQIRYQYSDKGIQEEINKIFENNELTQEAKDAALDGIFKNTENELSNFVTWLNDYGNTLANKKSFADRNMERNIGRNLYSSMSGIEARIASNTIGGNLSVSLTNFAPLFQAAGTTKINYLLTGMLQTTSNNIKGMTGNKDISFVDNSNFLTNRFGVDSIANKKITQKISDIASIPMNAIDEFTAESIVRAKYLENIDSGMTEEQALDKADKYAAKIMADRSKGALPIIFNAKNPFSKLVTMFQVEPNNIVSNYLKDMPREARNRTELTKQATKLMVSSYAFNTLVMAIRGGNEVLPDPIRWVSYLIKAIIGDDDEKEKAKKDLLESIVGSIPFASNLAGFVGMEDIGRIPISNAMPNINNIFKIFDSESDSQYRKETAIKEILKPFLYLGLPTGGAQIKKTVEGILTVSAGGSYKTDKEGKKILQFPVENPNVGDYIKAGIFGKYSLPMAKEYQNRNFKSLTAKQTKTYKDSNLPYKEYLEYIDAKLKKNEDKINYLNEKKWSENQKWGIYINDIFSSTERKEDKGSQVSDAEYITSNGISKGQYIKIYNNAQKNNIDMPTATEYKEMKEKGINLENYINYKINVKIETEKQKKNGELKNTQNLNNKDKIQILLDSNYSDKEKSAIYENYIKSESDTEYNVMKISGINITEYLKYKQQEFESDKKDDGTLTGKTINKSKQKKVLDYLNSMKITGNQRLLLYAMQGYTTTLSQKAQLANYVYNLKLTKEEKLKLYNKFSGFTVYKNGTVKW